MTPSAKTTMPIVVIAIVLTVIYQFECMSSRIVTISTAIMITMAINTATEILGSVINGLSPHQDAGSRFMRQGGETTQA